MSSQKMHSLRPGFITQLIIFLNVIALSILSPAPVFSDSLDEVNFDYSKHPLYSTYDFSKDSKVINFGTQPLAVPVGVIAEVMRRDRVLHRSLKERGREIRFHPFLKGADLNFFFKRGNIHAAMAGDMPAITLAYSDDISIAALAKRSYSAIVAKNMIQVSDLRGKRIGYPVGSTAHFALLTALNSVGLSETDVRMVRLDVNEMSDALHNDNIDAFAAWEPIPTMAVSKYSNFTVINRHLNSSYLYFSRSLVDRDREAVSLIMAAMIRAMAWMKQEEKNLLLAGEWTLRAGGNLQGKLEHLSAAQIADITKTDILSIASQPIIPERDFMEHGSAFKLFEFLRKQKKIPASAGWSRVLKSFDRKIISEVLANPKKYKLYQFDYALEKVN